MPKYVKYAEGKYVKVPDEWSIDQIKAELTKRGLLSAPEEVAPPGISEQIGMPDSNREQLLRNAPKDLRGKTFTEGLMAPWKPGMEFAEGIENPVGRAAAKFGAEQISAGGALMGAGISSLPSGIGRVAVGGFSALALKRVAELSPEAYRAFVEGRTSEGIEKLTEAGLYSLAAYFGARAAFKKPAVPGTTPKEPTLSEEVVPDEPPPPGAPPSPSTSAAEPSLVEDPVSGDIVRPNPPPSPQKKAELELDYQAAGVDTSDPVAVEAFESQRRGIKPADELTVGQVPTSKTTVNDDGSVRIDLKTGAPEEVLHEKVHQEAAQTGKPHPTEDNNVIIEEEAPSAVTPESPSPKNLIGTEQTVRGRAVRILSYDEMTDSYSVKDIKTGVSQDMPAESIVPEAGAPPTAKAPEIPIQPKGPYEQSADLVQDFESATGPYPGRATQEPGLAIEPTARTGEPSRPAPRGAAGKGFGPKEEAALTEEPIPESIDVPRPAVPGGINPRGSAAGKGQGPKEAATIADEPLPESLDVTHGGEDVARNARARGLKQREALRNKKDTEESDRIKKAFDDFVDFGIVNLVGAPITVVRNVMMQGFTGVMRAVNTSVARGIQRVAGSSAEPVVNEAGALARLFKSASEDRGLWTEIEKIEPEATRLEDRYMLAELSGEKRFSNPIMEKWANIVSYANKLQEGWFRKAWALNHLDSVALKKAGKSISRVVMDGEFNQVISADDLAAAIKAARKVTLSVEPEKGLAKDVLALRKHTVVRAVQPFMRFGYNNAVWLMDHSPLGARHLFGKGKFEALMKGDAEAMTHMTEAMSGTAMYMGAYMYASKMMKDADTLEAFGKRVNIGPMNPASAFFIGGYLASKYFKNDPARIFKGKEDVQYLLSAIANISSKGTGSGLIDNLMTSLGQVLQGEPDVVEQRVRESIGRWFARYTRPLGAINEIMSTVDPELAYARDASEHLWDPTVANVPWVNQTLPKRYGTDYAGPVKIESGAARQFTGLAFEKKPSAANDEISRLQIIPRYNVFPGLPAHNNEYRRIMMETIDTKGIPLVNSPSYKKANDETRRVMLQSLVSAASSAAKARALKDIPEDKLHKILIDRPTRLIMESQSEVQ